MNPVWRKSRRSTNQGGACVEVAIFSNAIGIRDSKNPGGGHLTLSSKEFATLIQGLKHGR
jgi:hypothetical protein